MLPIGDDNSDRTMQPYVTYALIAANVLVFILLQGMGGNLAFTYAYSTVPAEILTGQDIITAGQVVTDPNTGQEFELPGLQKTPVPVYLTLLSSMFMHGGWAHLGGNMLYLFIFGDNIENRLGRVKYIGFYLLTGIIASLSHVFSTYMTPGSSLIPSLGASGAISGVLGGYLVLYPSRKIKMLFYGGIIEVPSFIALGIWIVFQVISGLGMLGGEGGGGVAYAAHIGGFLAGMFLIKFFANSLKSKASVEGR
jgi:membrane associated rhomboid family serine protease